MIPMDGCVLTSVLLCRLEHFGSALELIGFESRKDIAVHIVQSVVATNQHIAKPDKALGLLGLLRPLLADQVCWWELCC